MSTNLVLGLFALMVALTTLVVRWIVPPPEPTVEDPYAHLQGRTTFSLVAFGLVPLLAAIAFFAAWWQERPPPVVIPHTDAVVHVRPSEGIVMHRGPHAPRHGVRLDAQRIVVV